ncbi:hypothetical protein [Polaribacter glomeratus]|uniref:Uncharacterized protein n=1 Tax=Polaribacter glomeratus TaxID=102 RepID=A0A2S7WUY3_9FLAO|nr:hypothetical protein [Polaribacter glomeratus]PQJ81399.1 hypothetical protein BTO16_01870 [Polaribacter glomeratus]TXD64801.1 hypothetical protein ESX12_13370 [Polaribacter glomeratus]
MKNKEHIDQQVEAAFNALGVIGEVKVNHFFKHKVLQQLAHQKEEKSKVFTWFTPQLQMASLALIVLLNASAILYAFSAQTDTLDASLETFAQEYSLQSETTSILN